jgi:redox-sensitive bicupin YhaK (pirin superfamily)
VGDHRGVSLVWQRAADRARTVGSGRDTRHSFSFGAHYDPANVGYGGLLVHNDDLLSPGAGYPDHAHADVEIVTWVLSGVLLHRDDTGGAADLGAGTLQVQSAGTGIRHSEIADPASGPTRFVQAWVRPDEYDARPARTLVAADPALAAGRLVPLVSGSVGAPARIGAAGATLWVARLAPGDAVTLPDDPLQHVFVARGLVDVAGGGLGAGDAVRVDDEPGHRVTATEDSELMAWTFSR